MQRAEFTTVAPGAPLPMNAFWRTIRGYVLWQYERGTLHYDIMVTLILIFIFFSPRVINFNDKPIARNPHPTDVVVSPDAEGHLLYQVAASAVSAGDEQSVRDQLLQIIEPISGAVSIVSYEPVSDGKAKCRATKFWPSANRRSSQGTTLARMKVRRHIRDVAAGGFGSSPVAVSFAAGILGFSAAPQPRPANSVT